MAPVETTDAATVDQRCSFKTLGRMETQSFKLLLCVSAFEHKHEKSVSLYVPLTASLWVSAGFSLYLSSCLRLSVRLSVCLRLSRSGACREKVSACLCVCTCHPRPTTTTQSEEKAPWMTWMMRQEMKTTSTIVAVNLVDVELLLGNMAGHGAGEVPSSNTVGTHQNEALVLQQIVCCGLHLSCDCCRERHNLSSRN